MKKLIYKNTKSRILMCMIVMSMLLFSCGTKEEGADVMDANSHVPGEEYVYVPQFHTIDKDELGGYANVAADFFGDKMYYRYYTSDLVDWVDVAVFESRDLNDLNSVQKGQFAFAAEDCHVDTTQFTIDEEGNVYIIWNVYPAYIEGEEYSYELLEMWLVKYNSEGRQEDMVNLKEDFPDEVMYVSDILVDKEGKIYLGTNSSMYVYNKKLDREKEIATGQLWNLFLLNGERICGVRHNAAVTELVEVDVKKNTTTVVYDEIPLYNSFFEDGRNGKVLFADYTNLYELDLETGEKLEVLNWMDCYMSGANVYDFEVLEDGRFAMLYNNNTDDPQVVFLSKEPRTEINEKEILTLATFTADHTEVLDAVVAFNRESGDYKVEIKNYYTYGNDFSQEVYDDALTLLHMDIVSGDAPDLIYLPDVDVYNLADSRALEDLTPFLETSQVVKKEDFIEEILEACEVEGKLVTIPTSFRLRTLFAKSRLVGEDPGWTLSEVMKLRETYPDAIFGWHWNRDDALKLCLEYGWDSFVDEETGECFFDSEEFVKVLEFARTFGPWGSGATQEPYDSLQKDETVLLEEVITSVDQYQMIRLLIEEPSTAIGYPTGDGTPVTLMMGWENYAIAARSDNKEGAWAFIESVLDETNTRRIYGFPTRTSLLEEMFAEAMILEYEKGADGNILYDDTGNPIEAVKTTWGNGSWTAQIYAATEEEIAVLRQMISTVRVEGVRSQPVLEIVLEEAAAYFADQKSAGEVAKIIQSRVSLYISENY